MAIVFVIVEFVVAVLVVVVLAAFVIVVFFVDFFVAASIVFVVAAFTIVVAMVGMVSAFVVFVVAAFVVFVVTIIDMVVEYAIVVAALVVFVVIVVAFVIVIAFVIVTESRLMRLMMSTRGSRRCLIFLLFLNMVPSTLSTAAPLFLDMLTRGCCFFKSDDKGVSFERQTGFGWLRLATAAATLFLATMSLLT